jgi:hypothetical protein
MPLVNVLVSGSWNISARAVAAQTGAGGGDGCVMSLDPGSATGTKVDATTVTNGATVTMSQCGLVVNADGGKALDVTGGAVLTAKSVAVFGAISVSGGAIINATSASWNDPISVTGGAKTNFTTSSIGSQLRVQDPYASVPVPTQPDGSYSTYSSKSLNHCAAIIYVSGQGNVANPACPQPAKRVSSGAYVLCGPTEGCSDGLQVLQPGVYNNGITMGNDAIVSMSPGIYVVNGGQFNVGGNVSMAGTGVTVVLGNSGSTYATVVIGNGAHVVMNAPTSGATSGLLFMQSVNAPTSGTNDFEGGSTEILTGALYFPHQTAIYSNGTNNTSTCTQLIAWHLQFVGGSLFNSNCGSAGTTAIGATPGPVNLVE